MGVSVRWEARGLPEREADLKVELWSGSARPAPRYQR